MNKKDRIKELVKLLNYYRDEYYNKHNSVISDFEYDQLFDELTTLEKETGFIMTASPTQTVGYEVKSELTKVKHNHLMLSLDKTKDLDDIKTFVGNKDWVAMLKMDGLTCSLLYENGTLVRAETRGDGEIGEDITHNAMVIPSIPKNIPYTDRLVVDGEIICKTDDFEEFTSEYKNIRNFASGSVRLLDSKECTKRKLTFVAWDIIGKPKQNSLWAALSLLSDYSFTVVPFLRSTHCTIEDTMCLKQLAQDYHYPIDGLVFKLDNCIEYDKMGRTDHHFRGGLAFKFYDELYETKLINIEWTMGKTQILTPTAVFETVNIDGTDVSKASLHNISIIKKIGLTNNCTVRVYKANQIIPQIDSCKQDGTSPINIPTTCPICNGKAEAIKENDSENLICTNPMCSGKILGQLKFFASKSAMNIDGLSEATLSFLISKGWVKTFKDIYCLKKYQTEWQECNGFGKRSVDKILTAIEKSRDVKLESFITALSIPNIGLSAAKTISKFCNGSYDNFAGLYFSYHMGNFNWTLLDDFGEVMAKSMQEYLEENLSMVEELADEMNFIAPEEKTVITNNPFNGKSLCVTGKLNHFTRDGINEKIISLGAKAVGSVSKKTDYLITNEASGSSKYKKAVELNIPIITEDEFLKMID